MRTVEVPIEGMDCLECTEHVQQALLGLAGVGQVEVLLAAERARVVLDPEQVGLEDLRRAVAGAGYRIPPEAVATRPTAKPSRAPLALAGGLTVLVVLAAVIGERLGWIALISRAVPWFMWVAAIVALGFPVFREVLRAAGQRRIIAHTLMSLGVLAAAAVGEWATALIVVFFMRIGDGIERLTVGRARQAVRGLMALAPQTARRERQDGEEIVPAGHVAPDDVVRVLPGESIPVDGVVLDGRATVDQAALTGESMPVEVGPGAAVYAASTVSLGTLRLRATAVGRKTAFGRVVYLVEEAERGKGTAQRMADRFAGYYLPLVLLVGLGTLVLRRDPLAAAAVLVVACSCAFTLATPMAMLASIGTAARRGLLIKGGRAIEALDRARVILLDKTGTLTLGRPEIRRVVAADGFTDDELLTLAAAAERYSEHPFGRAVRGAAHQRGLAVPIPEAFEAVPGQGVRATVAGREVEVGTARWTGSGPEAAGGEGLEKEGLTPLFVSVDGRPAGVLGAADAERPEVAQAVADLRRLGFDRVELITGDSERATRPLAERLGIGYRARSSPGSQDRDRARSSGHRAGGDHGRRRGQRCSGPGPGRRGRGHGFHRVGGGCGSGFGGPAARRLGTCAGGDPGGAADDADRAWQPVVHHRFQRRRPDPGGDGHPSPGAGGSGAVHPRPGDHGEFLEVVARQLTAGTVLYAKVDRGTRSKLPGRPPERLILPPLANPD